MGKTLIFILAFALASVLAAETPRDAGVEPLPPQSTTIDGVLVPVPREIFNTLDKFAHSDWRVVQRRQLAQWKARGDQEQIALLLGAVIAEGFIAVEAEDSVAIKNLGRAILTLSRGLGVEGSALKRSRSIVEHADRGDWPAVRKEWDGVLPDVAQGMKTLKSDQLAQLVSLGGWLRGAEALAALVLQDYSPERAALLRQPGLLDYAAKQLAGMSAEGRTSPTVAKMLEGVRKIRRQLGSDGGPMSAEDVKAIAASCGKMLQALNGPNPRD